MKEDKIKLSILYKNEELLDFVPREKEKVDIDGLVALLAMYDIVRRDE